MISNLLGTLIYSMLGMTKLIDHSINVAEHVIDLLIDIEAPTRHS